MKLYPLLALTLPLAAGCRPRDVPVGAVEAGSVPAVVQLFPPDGSVDGGMDVRRAPDGGRPASTFLSCQWNEATQAYDRDCRYIYCEWDEATQAYTRNCHVVADAGVDAAAQPPPRPLPTPDSGRPSAIVPRCKWNEATQAYDRDCLYLECEWDEATQAYVRNCRFVDGGVP
jgi:hypothetical protein